MIQACGKCFLPLIKPKWGDEDDPLDVHPFWSKAPIFQEDGRGKCRRIMLWIT